MKKKFFCIITGSRAEYGLLYPLIKKIDKDKSLSLQLIVTGSHLSKDHGFTVKEINNDNIKITTKVNLKISGDKKANISNYISIAIKKLSKKYEKLKPNLIIILGDRYEIFAAATAAMIAQIPIAHIHGGERTSGLIDEAIRHSITKMSHIHFAATKIYKKRILQLGENPKNVYHVGAPGVENIKNIKYFSKKKLEKDLEIKFGIKNLLITFHPVTLEKDFGLKQFKNLLSALSKLNNDYKFFFTFSNADMGGRKINNEIIKFVKNNMSSAKAFKSLGRYRYLSLLRYVDAVVGNSSSGLIEVPSFKIGTINIGNRQGGRVYGKTVLNTSPTKKNILLTIKKLYTNNFKKKLSKSINPYDFGKTSNRIIKILKKKDLNNLINKDFFDKI